MELHIVVHGKKDLSGQLYRQLREAILTGRLASGEQMPPSRLLSEQLGISRKTVLDAYTRLTLDNLLVGQVGIGTFVNTALPQRARPQLANDLAGRAIVKRWSALSTPLRHPFPEGQSRYEFIGGFVNKVPFPVEEWQRCIKQAFRECDRLRGRPSDTQGLLALRQLVAKYIGFSRGVRCSENDIVITNGAQQAIDLVARVLVEPGATVAVEEPGYSPARQLFASLGAKVVGVQVDAEGIVADAIPDGSRVIYVTPSHQFPLGMPMTPGRRHALLARAKTIGAIVIEDDYDSAFRYEGRPTDSLQSMDEHGLVAYVGTFSKVMLPELRVGYLVAPPAILQAVLTAKHLTDWHNATFMQHALANFIAAGHLQKHIRRCHQIYAGRREKLLHRLDGDLSRWLAPIPTTAGFHLTASMRQPVNLPLLLRLARRMEVGLYSVDAFYHDTAPQPALFFGFGAIDALDIDDALDRVRDVLESLS